MVTPAALDDLSDYINLVQMRAGFAAHPKGWEEAKEFDDFDIWLMLTPGVHVRCDGREHQLGAGDVFFLPPHVRMKAWNLLGPSEFIWVHFDFNLGAKRAPLNAEGLSGAHPAALVQREFTLVRDAYDNWMAVAPMGGLALKGALHMLVARLLSRTMPRSIPETAARARLRGALSLINKKLGNPPGNDALAAAAGMTPNYFITFFKKHLGLTPRRYLEQARLNRAAENLLAPHASVGEVADRLGFPDPFTFSKAFKKRYGLAPAHFMKRHCRVRG